MYNSNHISAQVEEMCRHITENPDQIPVIICASENADDGINIIGLPGEVADEAFKTILKLIYLNVQAQMEEDEQKRDRWMDIGLN